MTNGCKGVNVINTLRKKEHIILTKAKQWFN